MKTKLNVYKRKIYIPKDVENFPDNGKVTAYISTKSMFVVFDDSANIETELNSIQSMVEGDINANTSS